MGDCTVTLREQVIRELHREGGWVEGNDFSFEGDQFKADPACGEAMCNVLNASGLLKPLRYDPEAGAFRRIEIEIGRAHV